MVNPTMRGPARLITVHAIGLDEAAEQLTALARVRYVQLERGVACVQGSIAQLGRVTVGRVGGDRNKNLWVDTAPGKLTICIPTRGIARLGTSTLTSDHAVLASPATQVVAFTDRDFLPVSIVVAAHEIERLAAELQVDIHHPSQGISLLRLAPEQVWSIDRLAQDIFLAMSGEADSRQAECVAELEDEVLHWCAELLTRERMQVRALGSAVSRRRAALRAREFIDAHLDEHLSLAGICRASFSGARALQYGFREMFGLSPMSYVRCARLSRVRRDLYLAQHQERTVTQLAMRWGFEHLGQFSRDYCAMFGELPSSTLDRGREHNARAACVSGAELVGVMQHHSLQMLAAHAQNR